MRVQYIVILRSILLYASCPVVRGNIDRS